MPDIISVIIALVLVIVAAVHDLREFRIPNRLIVAGIVAGVSVIVIRAFTGEYIGNYILGTLVGLAGMIFLYIIRAVGAGDVKLFMLLGCYLEQHKLMVCIGIAMMLAGAAALVRIICSKECRQHVKEVLCYVYKMLRTGAMTDDMPLKSRAAVIRLAVPVLCSTLLCMGGVL